MRKVTYIISDINKALAFEWIARHLVSDEIELSFILLNNGDSHLETFLEANHTSVKRINLHKGWKMIFTFFSLLINLMRERPNTIHTHLRYASLLGITAGFLSGIKNRIHTRHNSSFHHIYHPHAVKYDKLVSRLSTKVVSISEVVSDVLINWENTLPEKIIKIPHGFDLSYFQNVSTERIHRVSKRYIPTNSSIIIGTISRYITGKGCEYAIEAFSLFLKKHPNAHLILANAKGSDANIINEKLKILPSNSYTEIEFEEDIAALYKTFDIFIHVPIAHHFEAFGQTYVEAIASGVPSIFTPSGIAREFIIHKENAWVVPFKNSMAVFEGMEELTNNELLRKQLESWKPELLSQFSLELYISRLKALYLDD